MDDRHQEDTPRERRTQKWYGLVIVLLLFSACLWLNATGQEMTDRVNTGAFLMGTLAAIAMALDFLVFGPRYGRPESLLTLAVFLGGVGLLTTVQRLPLVGGAGWHLSVPMVVAFLIGLLGLERRR